MRTLESARQSWQYIRQSTSLQELKEAVRLDGSSSVATEGGRSACWKAFLLFESVDISVWQQTLSSSRSAYNSLRAHFLRHLDNRDDVEADYDPLAEETEASPWVQLRKDEELRAEILQDVTRCMPENLYFRQPETQQMLLDILFVFCKLNPDISYRQGMHELLAPILWVVERDAIDLGRSSKTMGEDAIITNIFDPEHVEHDTFALFGQIMQSAKNFYEHTTTSGKENPIVARSRLIFDTLLPKVDEQLAKHLQSIDIVPQIFLMRWIRLLFGREFAFDDLLTMWDVLFAEDPTFDLVNEICLVMLLRIRWQLLDTDYNAALTLLLRYPEAEKQFSAQMCALDAVYLRQHLDHQGGFYLVSKYSGRQMKRSGRSTTPPPLQRNVTTVSGVRSSRNSQILTSTASNSARDINRVIQSKAREIYARGEAMGIGKVVRNAVEEVHKRAQEIRDAPTPSPPVLHRSGGSRSSFGADPMLRRIRALEDRNKSLAKLLEGATAELWAYQKTVAEQETTAEQSTSTLSFDNLAAAIAKVQFVQVYLEDPSLTLASDTAESGPIGGDTSRLSEQHAQPGLTAQPGVTAQEQHSQEVPSQSPPLGNHPRSPTDDLADPSSFEDIDSASRPSAQPGSSALNQAADSKKLARPPLEQSSFSWMLEDQKSPASTPSTTLAPRRVRGRGFLFGDEAT